MPRIQCPWITCKYNNGDYNRIDSELSSSFGECIFGGIVDLYDSEDYDDLLTCESWEMAKNYNEDGFKII